MNNILAIDTSSVYLSLGLKSGDKIYKFLAKVENKQSENIIPQITHLLHEANIDIGQVNCIAYNQGPGSFTGLRIGLSVALGIAFSLNIGLIPIPAFAIYALQAYELSNCKQVLVGLDARLNQLYCAGFDAESLQYFMPPQLINPAEVVSVANSVMIGNGFCQYKELLTQLISSQEVINASYPDASYLLKLIASGKFAEVNAGNADLLYLRNKVALNLDEQKNKNS